MARISINHSGALAVDITSGSQDNDKIAARENCAIVVKLIIGEAIAALEIVRLTEIDFEYKED